MVRSTAPQGFPADIDAGFDDIFDVLEMAAAIQFDARRDCWGFMADAFHAELGTSGTLSGPFNLNIDLDTPTVVSPTTPPGPAR